MIVIDNQYKWYNKKIMNLNTIFIKFDN